MRLQLFFESYLYLAFSRDFLLIFNLLKNKVHQCIDQARGPFNCLANEYTLPYRVFCVPKIYSNVSTWHSFGDQVYGLQMPSLANSFSRFRVNGIKDVMNLLIKMPFRAHLRASILLLCAGEQYNCQFESYGDLLPHNSLQFFYLQLHL